MKIKYLLLLFLMLPFISACDRSDDVMGIFTGKTWKLTYITRSGTNKPALYDFWDNATTYEKALKEMNKDGAYTLVFQGEETDDLARGTFSGKLYTLDYKGNWSADGKSNEFHTSNVTGGAKALLDSYFMEGISNATRYGGNYDNLYLYYTYKDKSNKEIELCLVFHVDK